MSHNAFAVSPNVPVEFVGGASQPYWQSSNGEAFHNTSLSVGNNVTYSGMTYIRVRNGSNQNYVVSGGAYVSLIGEVILRAHNTNGGGTAIASWASGYFGMSNDTSHTDCGMVDFDYNLQEYSQTTSPNEYYYRYTVEMICRVQSSGATNPTTNFNLATTGSVGSVVASFNLRRISVYNPVGEYDDTAIINAIHQLNSAINNLGDKIDNLGDHIDSINQDSADATQDSADEAQNEADSSSQSVDSTTQSLGSALTSISGALINAPATDCLINTNNNRLSLGTLNLCSQVPSNVLTIVSNIIALVFTPIVLYFAYNVITLLYNTFKEYFG